MIAIVDYGAGNLASVQRALEHLGHEVVLTARRDVLLSADRVVFPGQGHFGQAMARLQDTGLDRVLRDVLDRGTPFLGICLGLQLLFEASDEAPGVPGLAVLKGRCVRFANQPDPRTGLPLKCPQVGWNQLSVDRPGSPLDRLAVPQWYYFVHGYHAVAADPAVVVGTADYGGPFVAAVRQDHVFATQFHPEKSGDAGLQLLDAWLVGGG